MKTMTVTMKLDTKQYKNGVEETKQVTRTFTEHTNKSLEDVSKKWEKYGTVVNVAEDVGRQLRASQIKNNRETRNAAAYIEDLRKRHELASQMMGKTVEEQRRLNAEMRLGKTATQAQIAEVVKLETELEKMGTRGRMSMRRVRHGAQMASYQIQDIAVQAAMGTNAMIIMGQQGSQILSIFGAWGAAAGGILAIVAAIYQMSGAAETAQTMLEKMLKNTKELTDAQKEAIQVKMAEETEKHTKAMKDGQKELERRKYGLQLLAEQVERGEASQKVYNKAMEKFVLFKAELDTMKQSFKAIEKSVKSAAGTDWQKMFGQISKVDPYLVKMWEEQQKREKDAAKRRKQEAKQRQNGIDAIIKKLKLEADTYGQARGEVELYKLAQAGATKAEIDAAKEHIRIKNQKIEKEKEFKALFKTSKVDQDLVKQWEKEQVVIKTNMELYKAYGDSLAGVGGAVGMLGKVMQNYHRVMTIQSSITAISQAWASAPFPANLPAVATVTLETGALQSALELAGQFDTGGLIPSGKAGIVSEWGKEEVGRRGNGGGTMVINNTGESLGVSGRGKTSGGNGDNINLQFSYSIQAIDSRGVNEVLMQNKEAVYAAVRKALADHGKSI